MRVLVIEDDDSVRAALRPALHFAGYEVVLAGDGADDLLQAQTALPDAIVLDLGLPAIDGMEVCRRLRSSGDRTPILMLTARDAVENRLDGLEAGADDYLVKPYDVRELRARLRAILRRHIEGADGRSLRFGDLELDADLHAARIGERSVELTRTEFQLLELFMLNPRRVLSTELISDRVWGYDLTHRSNSLRVYIGYVRRELEAAGEPRVIQNVHGVPGNCQAGRRSAWGIRPRRERARWGRHPARVVRTAEPTGGQLNPASMVGRR
jgi:two-component system, OmpR family, response regulator MprA